MAKSEPVGNGLIALGFFSLTVGLLAAAAKAIEEELRSYHSATPAPFKENAASKVLQQVEELIRTTVHSAVELLVALRESPAWLVLIVLGVALILLGLWVKPAAAQKG